MNLYRKIDLFFAGDYLCSTQQAPTCKAAVSRYLETIDLRAHSFAGLGLIDSQVRKSPHLLKARFAR